MVAELLATSHGMHYKGMERLLWWIFDRKVSRIEAARMIHEYTVAWADARDRKGPELRIAALHRRHQMGGHEVRLFAMYRKDRDPQAIPIVPKSHLVVE